MEVGASPEAVSSRPLTEVMSFQTAQVMLPIARRRVLPIVRLHWPETILWRVLPSGRQRSRCALAEK